MNLSRRLARAEQVARAQWRIQGRHVFDDVVVPSSGDRIAFVTEQMERTALAQNELDPREWRRRSCR